MNSKVVSFSLVALLAASLNSFAAERQVKSITDELYANSFSKFKKHSTPDDTTAQSCHANNTAMVTIYSENGMAHSEIDVKVDGSPVGSLTTYYPDGGPGCKTPTARGIITLEVPAGKHILEADSPNINWPSQPFSVEKCECMLLPLS